MFNFGGSSSRSNSQSSSLGFGYGYSGNESLSDSLSRSSSGQTIAFEDLFRELYSGATGAAAKVSTLAPGLTDQANRLFSGGVDFLSQLQRTDDGVLNGQIDALGSDLGRFFREELNPAITSRGVATGTLGGGRQGVAQGIAARGLAEEFAQGSASLRAADRQGRDAAAATGLGALPGLFGLAQAGAGSELMPYQALAAILGGPTTLTSSSSDSIAQAISRAFGEDFSYDSSQSSSSSRSKAFSLGFGA